MYLSEKIYDTHSRMAINYFFFEKRNVYSQNNKGGNKIYRYQSIIIQCLIANENNQS
jgi:hypothetical protein